MTILYILIIIILSLVIFYMGNILNKNAKLMEEAANLLSYFKNSTVCNGVEVFFVSEDKQEIEEIKKLLKDHQDVCSNMET